MSVAPGENGRTRTDPGRDRGSVTVEAALVLPLLVLVMAVCLAGIVCLTAQLRCEDAAGAAARLYARGDTDAVALVVAQLAGDATVNTSTSGGVVRVLVTARPLGGLLPGVHVSAVAVAADEVPP